MSKNKQINSDHIRRRNKPTANNEVVEERLKSLLTPAVFGQLGYYQQLGMRNRLLGLPLMVAAILTLLWRQVPSVHELCRMVGREVFLIKKKRVSGWKKDQEKARHFRRNALWLLSRKSIQKR